MLLNRSTAAKSLSTGSSPDLRCKSARERVADIRRSQRERGSRLFHARCGRGAIHGGAQAVDEGISASSRSYHAAGATGSGLLEDATLRTLQAAYIAGIRAFAVHARDDEARAFYENFGFVPSPSERFHLFLLTKDVASALRKQP
jgi:hypothetical protein